MKGGMMTDKKINLTAEDIAKKRMELESFKLTLANQELQLGVWEKQLEMELPMKELRNRIAQLKQTMEETRRNTAVYEKMIKSGVQVVAEEQSVVQ